MYNLASAVFCVLFTRTAPIGAGATEISRITYSLEIRASLTFLETLWKMLNLVTDSFAEVEITVRNLHAPAHRRHY